MERGFFFRYARSMPSTPALESALTRASEENGLAEWYRDCVRPLLVMPETSWPRCCGHSCEPCSEQLKRVARRTLDLLAESAAAPGLSPP